VKRTGLLVAAVVFVALWVSGTAHSADVHDGTIVAVRPDNYSGGGVFIRVTGAFSGPSACSYPNGDINWYFITINNALMKELLAAALAAKSTGSTVTVVGTGVCTQGYEDVRYIEVD